MAQVPEVVRRSENVLHVSLSSGDSVVFKNVSDEAAGILVHYEFLTKVDGVEAVLLTRTSGHDAVDYVLLSLNTGDTVALDQPPAFSPSGTRFVSPPQCFEMGVCHYLVHIFRVTDGRFRRESTLDIEPLRVEKPEWLSETTIRLQRIRDATGRESQFVELVLEDGQWRMPEI